MSLLQTERLTLRPLTLSDAPRFQALADNRAIAENLGDMDHPFPLAEAERFIQERQELLDQGSTFSFGLVRQSDNLLIGFADLRTVDVHKHGEIDYWVGQEYWGEGYSTEAARALLAFGFREGGLHMIYATAFPENLASLRVMAKVGMKYAGTVRRLIVKWGEPKDIVFYDILRDEFHA